MEDRDIVALFLVRDEAAIGECEKKYGSLCLHVALRILGSPQDAEECVSDTWLRIWDAIPPADPRRLRTDSLCYCGNRKVSDRPL